MNEKGKVGIAVIGCGRIGRTHIESIKELKDIAFLSAVVDVDADLARQTAQKYGTKFYTSTGEAFNDANINAVVICLPNYQHAPVAVDAMEKNKHVLVEKPFALSLKDAERMVEMASQKHLTIMAGQGFRFFAGLREAQKRIKAEIGDPFNLIYIFALHFDKKKAPPWWRSKDTVGNLILTMLGSHTIDLILWLFEGKVPDKIYAQAASHNPDFDGPDEATILFRFKDGAMATNYLSLNTRPPKEECLVVGPKGTLHFKHGDTSEGLVGTASIEISFGENVIASDPHRWNNIKSEDENFVESILGRSEPLVKPAETILQMKVIEAAIESIKKGIAVQI